MSDVAIRVENLSKRYRIGLREEMHDSLAGALTNFVCRPIANLRRLRRLSRFSDNGDECNDVIWALKDISFEVRPGEVLGVIGRNGAGKSTLLKILSRITEPTSGRVTLGGRVSSLLEVGTGFHPELTGRENVYLNGTILGMSKREVDLKFDEIVDFSGVEKFIDTPVKRYSSGMRVRLAFSVAAHLEPEILLIDEVLAVGDLEFQTKCIGKMDEISKVGRTILFVSHNMAAISAFCHRVILLEKSKIAFEGCAQDAIDHYQTSQVSKKIGSSYKASKSKNGLSKCYISGLRFEDTKGNPLTVLQTGQSLRIRISYNSVKDHPLSSVKAIIYFVHNLFGPIIACKSAISGHLQDAIPPNGNLICRINKLPLTPGVFVVRVALKIKGEVVDRVDNAVRIRVESGDYFGTGKLSTSSLFIVDYDWYVEDSASAIPFNDSACRKQEDSRSDDANEMRC